MRAQVQPELGTVVIVRVPRDAGVMARIRAELVANDWRVREIGPDASSARASLPAIVLNMNARAALRMQPARGAVELFVASEGDSGGGGELVRLPAGEQDDGLLALRATEALRARGLKLVRRSGEPAIPVEVPAAQSGEEPASQPSAAEPSTAGSGEADAIRAEQERARKQAEAARLERERQEREAQAARERGEQAARERAERERAEREAEEEREATEDTEAEEAVEEAEELEEPELDLESNALRPSLLFVEVGPAIGYSPGGTSVSVAGYANVRVQPLNVLSFSAFAYVPFAGGTVERDASSGTMRSYFLGGAADLHGRFERFDLTAGAGGALLITSMDAETEDVQLERANGKLDYTGAAIARVGLHFDAAPRVRVGARVVFGLALPKLIMKFGPDEVATWGHPFLLAALTVDFGLPAPLRPR